MFSAQTFLDQLSTHLFWDVNRDSVDAEAHADYLIWRIMERGTQADVRSAWVYYGEGRIRQALMEAPSLTAKTMSFFANQFALPREAFRAYQRSSNWNQ